MADIGFHPRLAAVALEGRELHRVDVAAEVIAVLETSRSGDVDLAERVRQLRSGLASGDAVNALRLWRRSLGVDRGATTAPLDVTALDDVVARLVLAGYSDRLARRRDASRTDDRGRAQVVFHLRSAGEVAVAADEPLARSRWLVVADLDAGAPGRPGRPHLAAALSETVVVDAVDPLVHSDDVVEWDPRRRDVASERRRHLGAITISSEPLADPDRAATARAILVGIRTHGLGLLGQIGRADDLRRRVGWLHAVRPDDGWPDWSDESLLADLDGWLAPSSVGCGGLPTWAASTSAPRCSPSWTGRSSERSTSPPDALDHRLGATCDAALRRGRRRAGHRGRRRGTARRDRHRRAADRRHVRRADHPGAPLARRTTGAAHRGPTRLLAGQLCRGALGPARPLPEAPVAGAPVGAACHLDVVAEPVWPRDRGRPT